MARQLDPTGLYWRRFSPQSSNYILPLSVLLKIIIVDMAAGGLDPTGLYWSANCVTAFLKRLLSYFRISKGVSLICNFKLCIMAGLDPTGQYWGRRERSEKRRGSNEDSRVQYLKVATWLLSRVSIRPDNIKPDNTKASEIPKQTSLWIRWYRWWKK